MGGQIDTKSKALGKPSGREGSRTCKSDAALAAPTNFAHFANKQGGAASSSSAPAGGANANGTVGRKAALSLSSLLKTAAAKPSSLPAVSLPLPAAGGGVGSSRGARAGAGAGVDIDVDGVLRRAISKAAVREKERTTANEAAEAAPAIIRLPSLKRLSTKA